MLAESGLEGRGGFERLQEGLDRRYRSKPIPRRLYGHTSAARCHSVGG